MIGGVTPPSPAPGADGPSEVVEGTVVTMNADPEPGRLYEIVGAAPQPGSWWAYPIDGRPVPLSLRRANATGNAAWVTGSNSRRVAAVLQDHAQTIF